MTDEHSPPARMTPPAAACDPCHSSSVIRHASAASGHSSAVILLVEDNPADARLVREAVAENDIEATLHCAGDGATALDFVRRRGAFADAPTPDLVLLDLNLPGIGGKEVLREIKSDPALKRIPVVVLSSSAAPRDVFDAYDAQANSYLIKPTDFDEFVALVRTIETYWLRAVQLPSRAA